MKGRLLFWVVIVLLALVLAAEWTRASRRLQASRTLRSVEATSLEMARQGIVPRPMLQAHIHRLQGVERLDPANYAIAQAIGSQYFLMGSWQMSVRWYRRALEIEPRTELYLNLARALEQAGEHEEAVATMEIVRRLDPQGRLSSDRR